MIGQHQAPAMYSTFFLHFVSKDVKTIKVKKVTRVTGVVQLLMSNVEVINYDSRPIIT